MSLKGVRVRQGLLALAGLLMLGATGLAVLRTLQLERAELEHVGESAPLSTHQQRKGSTRVSARLLEVELRAGQHAVFELCSLDGLPVAQWRDSMELAVLRLQPLELMLKVPLDAEHLAAAQRSSRGACLVLARGPMERAGRYSVDAVWPGRTPAPALMAAELRARVLGQTPLTAMDRNTVLALAVGVLLALCALLFAPHGPGDETLRVRSARPAVLGTLVGLGSLAAVSVLPLWGSTMALAKGAGMAFAQLAVALLFARLAAGPGAVRPLLALSPPRQRALSLTAAVLGAGLLVLTARIALRLVPATEEAPIQAFIAWPSGMLSFAALGVLLPVAEEVFFRGLVYRAALPLGRTAAFLLTVVLFTAMHAPQSWGNWGSLLAIGITGSLLTGLRAWSGSTLVPALAHLLYNLTLSLGSL